MTDKEQKAMSAMAATGYEYLLPIITKYDITTVEHTNALIAAFQAGTEYALKQAKEI